LEHAGPSQYVPRSSDCCPVFFRGSEEGRVAVRGGLNARTDEADIWMPSRGKRLLRPFGNCVPTRQKGHVSCSLAPTQRRPDALSEAVYNDDLRGCPALPSQCPHSVLQAGVLGDQHAY